MHALSAAYESSSENSSETDAAGAPAPRARRSPTSLPVHVYLEVPAAVAGGASLAALRAAYVRHFDGALARALRAPLTAVSASARWAALPLADAYVPVPLHISLSRYCELRAGAGADGADAFVAALRGALAGVGGGGAVELSLDGCVVLPSARGPGGGSGSALFLCAMVGAGRQRVLALLAAVDSVMRAFGLPEYYVPAEAHVSLSVLRVQPSVATSSGGDSCDGGDGGAAALAAAVAALEAAGESAVSALDVGLADLPPVTFAAEHVRVKVGKRVFKISM